MDKREKTDFILEQMRLCLAKKEYTRVLLISKKISTKFFENEENHVVIFMHCSFFPSFLASLFFHKALNSIYLTDFNTRTILWNCNLFLVVVVVYCC